MRTGHDKRLNGKLDPGAPKRLFPRDGISWRVNREMILLLGGGRALLMQVAHPKVAAAVAEHSDFAKDPLGRLHRTMNTMWSIVFDEIPVAQASLDRIKNVHQKVRGVVGQSELSFASSRYDALDPELLFWVHATLVDSSMLAYDRLVKPLPPVDASRYYEESKLLAQSFEIPEGLVPKSLGEFHAYMDTMLAGKQISVGPAARSLAKDILYPPTRLLKPAGPLLRLITSGLLPPTLRESYEIAWNKRREKAFKLVVGILRNLLPLVPGPLRIVPQARAAEKARGGI